MWITAAVCLGAGQAAAQASVEYGAAVTNIGGSVAAAQKAASAHLPSASLENVVGVNRRALGARASKEAVRPMSRSVPNSPRVPGDGKAAQKPASARLASASGEDVAGVNRHALEAHAGKDAAKLMLRSVPDSAWVRINGKVVGQTPLLIQVAPGIHQVEMESALREAAQTQVKLLPKERQEIQLTLVSRYPAHVQISWPRY